MQTRARLTATADGNGNDSEDSVDSDVERSESKVMSDLLQRVDTLESIIKDLANHVAFSTDSREAILVNRDDNNVTVESIQSLAEDHIDEISTLGEKYDNLEVKVTKALKWIKTQKASNSAQPPTTGSGHMTTGTKRPAPAVSPGSTPVRPAKRPAGKRLPFLGKAAKKTVAARAQSDDEEDEHDDDSEEY